MHEMALVRNIVEIVKDEADAAGAKEVTSVHIVLGEGRDIVVDLFEGLFQFLARDSVAENATIELEHVPYEAQCNQCGEVFHVAFNERDAPVCPKCGAERDYKLVGGMEFYISKIEAVPL